MRRTYVNRRAWMAGASAGVAALATRATARDAKPAAPTTPPPALEVYARLPVVEQIAISPDGHTVAVATQKGDQKALITFLAADLKPKAMALGPQRIRDMFFGDNSHVVVMASTTVQLPGFSEEAQEFSAAVSIDFTNAKGWTFFQNQMGGTTGTIIKVGDTFYPIVIGSMQRIKVNGDYRVTAMNYRFSGEYSLCLFNFGMESNAGRLMVNGSEDTDTFVVTPDGQVAAFSAFNEERKEWSLAFNGQLGTGHTDLKPVYHTTGQALNHPELIGLGRDGKSVIIKIFSENRETQTYHEIGADGVLSPSLPEDPGGVRFALFHPTTFRLCGFGQSGDWNRLSYFDPLMQKLTESVAKMVDGERFIMESFADDPRQMIVYSEGEGDAGSYYYIDLTTGDGKPVASNYPDLPAEWITQKKAIDYKAADGLNIHAYLTLPPFREARNLPLIVLPHGGPEEHDDISFDWQAQAFASRGYAVLQPNFRGSSGYGQAFINAGHGEWGRKMQTDLSDGVRYLAAQGLIDPKRVAIFGESYGGYAALAGATIDTGVYNCAVSVAGISDLKAIVDWEDSKTGYQNDTVVLADRQFMGDPSRWGEISPAKQAAKASCPVLVVHGTDDTRVPIEQSYEMQNAMKAAGKEVQLITYKGQTHWEDDQTSRIAMMQAAMDFIQKHNPA